MASPKRILIVDDEPKIVKAFCESFRFEEDFIVEGLTDGAEAIKRLQSEPPFDLVILDWRLRGDVQGRDVMGFIKDDNPELPVWVVTASIHFLDEIKAYKPLASFLKPCADLRSKITEFLRPEA